MPKPSAASSESRQKFEKQVEELCATLEELRPGTGAGIQVLLTMAYEQAERDTREQLAQHIYDETCRRAEDKMLKTGKLEGAHFAALKEVLGEIKAERVRGKG